MKRYCLGQFGGIDEDPYGDLIMFGDHEVAILEKDEEIEKLKEELAKLEQWVTDGAGS